MLRYYVYNSFAADPREATPDLRHILSSALRNNAALGLTGFLAYADGVFAQYLEGPHESVALMARRIETDPSHYNITSLASGTRATRLFETWDMGFASSGLGLKTREFAGLLLSGDADRVIDVLCRCERNARAVRSRDAQVLSAGSTHPRLPDAARIPGGVALVQRPATGRHVSH